MSMTTTSPAAKAAPKRTFRDPIAAGLPDPRAVTMYTAEYAEEGGKSRVKVTLDQPCVIREPVWGVVSCLNGEVVPLPGKDQGGGVIVFEYDGILEPAFNFLLVPYQDAQVQNFRGGFVEPGARWFRAYEG